MGLQFEGIGVLRMTVTIRGCIVAFSGLNVLLHEINVFPVCSYYGLERHAPTSKTQEEWLHP